MGGGFYPRHHQDDQDWDRLQVLWADHPQYKRHDEGRGDVPDHILRHHARLFVWSLLHVQLPPGDPSYHVRRIHKLYLRTLRWPQAPARVAYSPISSGFCYR